VSILERYGWNAFFLAQVTLEPEPARIARVVEEQRGLCRVVGDFDGWAEVSGRFRHAAASAADFPVVGDWVVVAAEPGAHRGVIQRRLERRSTVSRKAAGRAVNEQVLAANVDTMFLVTAVAGDLNARRVERYLTLAWETAAMPVVVINKADLSEDASGVAADLRRRLPFVDVVLVSALTTDGLGALTPYLQPGATVVLLGSSGVGKSTLVNRLLGRDRQRVGGVRESDGKGRHTTRARQLVELPGGALLIDTPGIRELQPWVDETAVDGVFEEIVELAASCRFSDCRHADEPGCAVLDAAAAGTLDAGRLEHYRRLVREAAFEERKRNKAAAAEDKRRWKQIHQAQRARYRERDRSE
jgi:ribosome biogenesis GTPase